MRPRHAVFLTPPIPLRSRRNSHGIISFTDPHPLTLLESYRFKNEHPARMRVPSDHRESRNLSSSPKSLPHNLFADPHPLTPVLSVFYKNSGGRGGRDCISGTRQRRSPFVFKRFHTLCPKHPGWVGGHLSALD